MSLVCFKKLIRTLKSMLLYLWMIFVFYNCKNAYKELINELVEKFRIKDLGQMKKCLGMNINIYKVRITVDQKQYRRLANNTA